MISGGFILATPISIRIFKTKTSFGQPKNFFLKIVHQILSKEHYLTNDFTHGIESPKTDDKLPILYDINGSKAAI